MRFLAHIIFFWGAGEHSFHLGIGVLCAYMISKERTQNVYKLFMETLIELTKGEWHPRYCKADFEKAIHNGISVHIHIHIHID
jgi:hypothetical protein